MPFVEEISFAGMPCIVGSVHPHGKIFRVFECEGYPPPPPSLKPWLSRALAFLYIPQDIFSAGCGILHY
jgi:hypothetical protein